MITTGDVGNILYRDTGAFGVADVCRVGNIPTGKLESERIVIIAKRQGEGTYWRKGFIEVNLCVPDNSKDVANTSRLTELERKARILLDRISGRYDNTTYCYGIESTNQEKDAELECHYVNVRIIFEVLNCQ